MNFFVSVNFSQRVRKNVNIVTNQLKTSEVTGNFTRKENLHLTLAFLGNDYSKQQVIKALDHINIQAFDLTLTSLGQFPQREGRLLWLGVEESPNLLQLYNEVNNQLARIGFIPDSRKFTPHITLVRKANHPNTFNIDQFSKAIKPITTTVNCIYLMESVYENNQVIYKEHFRKDLLAKTVDGLNKL